MLFLGPIFAVAVGILVSKFCGPTAGWTAGISALVATWWITEPIPIPATSLIPLVLFPVVGVLTPEQVAASYGHKLIMLMLGGFILSAAMERSGAHRRIALGMVNAFGGGSGKSLVFGFMAASAFLSMWISNAATTLMLLPIAMAVVSQSQNRAFQSALVLGIAFAASIGGIGTPIGTPPNVVFMAEYKEVTGTEIGFVQWMIWSVPVVVIMLPIAGFWLCRKIGKIEPIELPEVGHLRPAELRTLIVFVFVAAFWVTRAHPFGGWSSIASQFGFTNINDSTVALLGAIVLFLIPNGERRGEHRGEGKGERLMDWKTAQKIPWGVLILFAGGICMAQAFKQSGLSADLGEALASLGKANTIVLIYSICLAVTFLTEVTSNTATTTLLMPIFAAAAVASETDPRIFMVPATLSASFAFMLPVATPPNAIVFGSGHLTVRQMARGGFALNLIGVVIVSQLCLWLFG